MSDEEKKDVVEDTPKDEATEAAGPVAGEASSSSQAAAEEPTPTPPAEEAVESKGGTPEAESSDAPEAEQAEPAAAPEAPAAEEAPDTKEEPAAEPNPEDDLPWKERRRLERSRQPHKAGVALSTEERIAKRAEERKLKAESRRKERAAAKQGKTAGTGTPQAEKDAVAAKTRQGVVVSSKGEKSITVRIDIARRHPTYEKVVRRSRTLHAHDEQNEAGEGDTVRVVETRPLSKTKRWRLVEVLEKAK
jgi:small subunit ribosomal protein S17